MTPSISVIIPVHGIEEAFRACLMSVIRLDPPPLEVIVVADGDECSARLAESMECRVIRIPVAGGPAAARNRGADHAVGDVLFFLDADVTASQNAIERVTTHFQEYPDTAAVIGSYDDQPGQSNFLSQYRNLFHHYVHQQAGAEVSTFWGACGAIRKDVFLHTGGFDEQYRYPSIEDIELGLRLTRAGYRIHLDKTLRVKHLKRWGVYSMLYTDIFRRALPWTALILRDRHFPDEWHFSKAQLTGVASCGLLAVSLAWTAFRPEAAVLAAIFALILLILNHRMYRFFAGKRNLWFAIRTIPWHWLYCFYSGTAFITGLIRHLFNYRPSEKELEKS